MAFCTCDHLEEDGVRRDSPALLRPHFFHFNHNLQPRGSQAAPQLQSSLEFTCNYLWNESVAHKTWPKPLILRIRRGGGYPRPIPFPKWEEADFSNRSPG